MIDYYPKVGFKIFTLGGYPFSILLSIGKTPKQIIHKLEQIAAKNGNEGLSDEQLQAIEEWDCPGYVVRLAGCDQVLILKEWDGRPRHKATLAHEIFHVVSNVMHAVRIPLSHDSEEAWAYALQDLTYQIAEWLEKD